MKKHPEIPTFLLQGTKNRKDLAQEYRMSESSFYRRLKKHKIVLPRGLLLPKDYIVVYEKLGVPRFPPPDEY